MWKLGKIFALLRNELRLVWALLRNPQAPRSSKVVALLALLYVVSPIDLVPDAVPILGWLDDGLVAYLVLQAAFKLLPAELYAALQAQVQARSASPRASARR